MRRLLLLLLTCTLLCTPTPARAASARSFGTLPSAEPGYLPLTLRIPRGGATVQWQRAAGDEVATGQLMCRATDDPTTKFVQVGADYGASELREIRVDVHSCKFNVTACSTCEGAHAWIVGAQP